MTSLLALLLLGVGSNSLEPTLAQASQTTAFVNANVIPMDTERVLENQTVIVEGDRITAIGPVDEVTVPEGADIIQGKAAYLVPGLANMHMHLQSIVPAFEGHGQLPLYLSQGVVIRCR